MADAGTPDWSYWDWHRELASAFLVTRPAHEAFVLHVDDDELRRLWPDLPDAAASLSTAVSRYLRWEAGAALFEPIVRATELQRRAGGPPGSLPLLAVTVLAASRMRREDTVSSNAYFIRLAQALRPALEGPLRQKVCQQLSTSFGLVADMWRDFDEWLRRTRTYGTSSIQGHPHLTRIGFPLSQALVRESDRMRLTAFLHDIDVGGRGVPPKNALVTYLHVWASRPRGLSETFLMALDEPQLRDLVVDAVLRLAVGWDGVVRNPGGKRRLDLRLVLDLDEFEVRWAAIRLPELQEDTLVSDDGHRFSIRAPEWGSQYIVTGAPPPTVWLCKRTRASSDHCSALIDVPDVLVARENADAGGWLAANGLELHEEHVLVVTADLQEAAEQMLEQAAEPGWQLVQQRPPRVLLPGRCIYRRVRISDPGAFERAFSELSPKLMRSLRPETPPRPRLVNGLRVAAHLGPHHYLCGGEPDLLLPAGPDPRTVPTALDGSPQVPPFLATGFPIALRRTGPLPRGRHEVVTNGEALAFYVHDTVDSSDTAPAVCTAGWQIGATSATLTSGQPSLVAGARVDGSLEEPRLLRRISEWHVVNRDGGTRRLTAPPPATWVSTYGLPSSQHFDFIPEPGDAWLVEFRQGKARMPGLLKWHEPTMRGLNDADRHVWMAMNAFAGSNRLLDLYLKAARL